MTTQREVAPALTAFSTQDEVQGSSPGRPTTSDNQREREFSHVRRRLGGRVASDTLVTG
jgi:hypothetical protein